MAKSVEKFYIELKGGIDLDKTEKSGQCFRWIKSGDGYIIPAFGMLAYVTEAKGGVDIELLSTGKKKTDIKAAQETWSRYFDAELDYSKIRRMPDKKDRFLSEAAASGEGIRIIYQDSFETLITFIISQRKSIPAIKTSVERICESVGRKISGTKVYDFPSPEELSKLSADELSACGLGYRASYIHETAEMFARGELDAEYLGGLDDEALISSLMSLKGVGIKVANCTALFGFHRLDLFPIDVWIQRALDTYYNGTFPLEKYHPYNGIMQQYIFAYRGQL
ncbi:MAG: DNA-3-methyladenine glycosylase 2 family protein [Lachnospiraceae bacterium]|nr:DNA-3-methyladenine glycosylase 2 family protein [Lachnospiraceae bacterium]